MQFIPWHNALKAFSCSFPMGTKVLSGKVLLADVLARQPDTHSIEFEITQKVPVYTGMQASERRAAEAYNAWLLLARHTSAASNKIYLWIYKGVDATIKHTIVAKTGDGYGAFMVIKQMFDKPSRMLQRKLVSFSSVATSTPRRAWTCSSRRSTMPPNGSTPWASRPRTLRS